MPWRISKTLYCHGLTATAGNKKPLGGHWPAVSVTVLTRHGVYILSPILVISTSYTKTITAVFGEPCSSDTQS